jgi:hypothetical protein
LKPQKSFLKAGRVEGMERRGKNEDERKEVPEKLKSTNKFRVEN